MASQPRLGVDLGGTKTEAILLSADGTITHRLRTATPANDYDATVRTIAQLCDDIEREAGVRGRLAIGMGTPGAVSFQTGRMKNCNHTCLNDRDLAADLAAVSRRRVRIANDADCLAMSEAADGAAAGAGNVFAVILGTGVGGGIVVNRQLVRGINAIAGEWGHNPIAANAYAGTLDTGRRCYCGKQDCVETWLSGPGLAMSYARHTGIDRSARDIADLANSRDTAATEVIESYAHVLALALSGVINILDPEVIVLGGGVSNIDVLYDRVPVHLARYVFSDRVDTRIVRARHGDSSGVRGAAWLWEENP